MPPPRPAAPPNPDSVGAARQDPSVGSSERLKLPHERDESPTDVAQPGAGGHEQHQIVRQADEDLARGLQDTDCRVPHGPGSACPPAPEIEPELPAAVPDRNRKRRPPNSKQ